MIRRFLAAVLLLFASSAALAQRPDLLEVISIDTAISDATARTITEQVEKINENPKIKAVLLQLDTPGGGAVASSVIHEELSKIKVPVVVWCMNVCASGGVYASMATSVKFIAVRRETIGGSVGVIMEVMRYNRLLDWAKIDMKTYVSGVLKDSFNPSRAGNEADDAYLKSLNSSFASRFYGVVEKGRGKKINADNWEKVKSARIFIGSEIVDVGLADAVMDKDQVIAKAKELSGSKLINTREELGKMSKAANDNATYSAPVRPVGETSWMADVSYLVNVVKEIHSGQKVKIQYLLPIAFQ